MPSSPRHFAEANPGLDFDREAAWGHRLAVPAGTSVRFEPGISREVALVPLGGRRIVPGLRGEAGGSLDRTKGDALVSARSERLRAPQSRTNGKQ